MILLISHCFPSEFFIRECGRNLREHTSEEHINIYLKHNVKTISTCCELVMGLARLCGFQTVSWLKKGNYSLIRLTVGKRLGIQGHTVFLINVYRATKTTERPVLNYPER